MNIADMFYLQFKIIQSPLRVVRVEVLVDGDVHGDVAIAGINFFRLGVLLIKPLLVAMKAVLGLGE